MQRFSRISIAVVCALGVTAAIAQTVQPRGQGATQVRPPLQTAQAPGGAAVGGSTATGATAVVGATTAGTVTFVTMGAVAVAGAASDNNSSTVTHNP